MKRFFLPLLLALAAVLPAAGQRPVRVACVGNSVTYGVGVADSATQAYPAQLASLLGPDYEVRGFGHSGTTLLSRGPNPYVQTAAYRAALAFKPDVVVIHLGLNDTDPQAWPLWAHQFVPDYLALAESFRQANREARIWACILTPIFTAHRRFDSSTRAWHRLIRDSIVVAARQGDMGLIDLYTLLHRRPDLFPDALHPNAAGAALLARQVCAAVTGQTGPLRLAAGLTDGAVLQRGRPLRIGGWAAAGERVSVRFAGQRFRTTAGSDGAWSVAMPPQPAGGPHRLEVSASRQRVRIGDVWVGEVWLAAGLADVGAYDGRPAAAAAEVAAPSATAPAATAPSATAPAAAADDERVHLLALRPVAAPADTSWSAELRAQVDALGYFAPARWQRPETAAPAAEAAALAFARTLADSLGCHVGVVSAEVPFAPLEAWTPRGVLEEEVPAIFRAWTSADYLHPAARRAAARLLGQPERGRHPYEPAYLFEAAFEPLAGMALRGVAWGHGAANAHNAEHYARLFPLWREALTRHFGADSLAMVVVEQPPTAGPVAAARLAATQRSLAAECTPTWLVPAADLYPPAAPGAVAARPGAAETLGRRLALEALRRVYW